MAAALRTATPGFPAGSVTMSGRSTQPHVSLAAVMVRTGKRVRTAFVRRLTPTEIGM